MRKIFLFPGQGVQYAQMYSTLKSYEKEVSVVFEEAATEVGRNVKDLCQHLPNDALLQTENTQVAMLTMNMAYYKLLTNRGVLPNVVAGHSLGQYSAFVASGCLSFKEVIRIVNLRGQLMSNIGRKGCMYLVLGLEEEVVKDICAQVSNANGIVTIALYNTPSHIIIAGDESCVENSVPLFESRGALKVQKLAVSHAFHTDIMAEMLDDFKEAVEKLELAPLSKIKIVLNSTGQFANDHLEIKTEMISQCILPVRWSQSIQYLSKEFPNSKYYEVGPGCVLSKMARQIDKKCSVENLDNIKKLQHVLSSG